MPFIAPSRRAHPRARLLPARRALVLVVLGAIGVAAPPAPAQTVQGIVEDATTHLPVGGARLALLPVDSTGQPDVSTFLLLEATNDQFADAVHDVLRRTRYFPAELDGRHVPQVTGFDVDFGFFGDSVQVSHDYGADVMVVRALSR